MNSDSQPTNYQLLTTNQCPSSHPEKTSLKPKPVSSHEKSFMWRIKTLKCYRNLGQVFEAIYMSYHPQNYHLMREGEEEVAFEMKDEFINELAHEHERKYSQCILKRQPFLYTESHIFILIIGRRGIIEHLSSLICDSYNKCISLRKKFPTEQEVLIH